MFHQTMVGASDYSQKADLIDTLMQAIEDRRAAFITYQSLQATEPVTYDIYPYGLTYHRGSLYLVGRKVEQEPSSGNDFRHWKVDRIEAVKLEDLRFKRPDGFDLAGHFARSFGIFHGDGQVHVKVRFSPTGGPLRRGIHVARQPKADQRKGRWPAGRVRPRRHRRDHAMDPQLRPPRRGAGAGRAEAHNWAGSMRYGQTNRSEH